MKTMLRRWRHACGVIFALPAVSVASETLTIEVRGAYVGVSGVRTYDLPAYKMRQNLSAREKAAGLRVAYDATRWSVGAGYTIYETLRAEGYSQNSDIFDRHSGSLQVIIPLTFAERVREYSVDARWQWAMTRRLGLAVGPVVSWFDSIADLNTISTVSFIGGGSPQRVVNRIAHYREGDLRLGGMTALSFAFTPRWKFDFGYRYVTPPSRTLHVWSAGLERRF